MENTPLAAKALNACLESHSWTQQQLADKTSIARSTISFHLVGERAIRDDHLASYLEAFPSKDRPMLLAAWFRDVLKEDVVDDLLEPQGKLAGRIKDQVRAWSSKLDAEQQGMLKWWSEQLARDPELDAIFRAVSRRAGYNPKDK